MTCDLCVDGFVAFVLADNTKSDAAIEAKDLFLAVCLCELGRAWRVRENCRRKVAPLWVAWCAKQGFDTDRVCMVEDVYTPAELAAVGLVKVPSEFGREKALLARGRSRP